MALADLRWTQHIRTRSPCMGDLQEELEVQGVSVAELVLDTLGSHCRCYKS